jgi:hypothetical protein
LRLAPVLVLDDIERLFAFGGPGLFGAGGLARVGDGRGGFELRFERRLTRLQAAGLLLGLQHHIGFERLADLRLEFQDRQLQQADGLLQLRGHGQLLAESELQGGLEHSSRLWV